MSSGWDKIFYRSAWKGKKPATPEDIVWHAMKSPPDQKGAGGNRTAQILLKNYEVNVGESKEKDLKHTTSSPKKTFSKALDRVKTEKDILKTFITNNLGQRIGRTHNNQYWNGIHQDNLRLIDIIRVAGKNAQKINGAEYNIHAKLNPANNPAQTELILEKLAHVKKEDEVLNIFYKAHKKDKDTQGAARCLTRSQIDYPDEKSEPKKLLVDLIKAGRGSCFFSGDRSNRVFERLFPTINIRDANKTPEEIAQQILAAPTPAQQGRKK